jgi:hypothetical protein
MDNIFETDFNIENLLQFLDKNVPNFSNEPIVEKDSEGVIEYEFYDIKSPASLHHPFMHLRVYNDRQIYFLGRDQSELIKTFNYFKAHEMNDSDLLSIIDIINKTGEKYGIYNKDKNKVHEKKIKKLLKNRNEVTPEVFFKTVYDIVGVCGKGAWSKHGPTYIKRQYFILDDCSLLEWYIINYPMTGNLKVIINVVKLDDKLMIAVKFKESDELIMMEDIEEFQKIVDDKFLAIYLPMIKKHLGNDRKAFNQDDITLLRMVKI